VSRDTRRQIAARFVNLFYARDICRSSDKISSVGGQIVSVLPMSFRIEEWKMDTCVIYFVYRRIAGKRRKSWAVHPINSAKFVDGAFRNLYEKLRDVKDKFFNDFRMSIASFDELMIKIQGTIQARQDLVQGLSCCPHELLAVKHRQVYKE
jgi:hypothetical protein